MKNIKTRANAKINLGLRVKYRRNDGFHEIESIFQEIDFADEIMLKPIQGISFSTDSDELKIEENNLCTQAAELLIKETGIEGLSVKLEKNIPIGAGLGGGSADAAAVLKGGLELYDVKLENQHLLELAAKLGSDVPFFVSGKTAHVSGRGEVIQPCNLNLNYYVLLVMPQINISTADAYKSLTIDLTWNDNDDKFKSSNLCDLDVKSLKNIFKNDFEKCIFEKYSELATIKNLLYSLKSDFASLSGSGSTIYGLFSSFKYAESAYQNLKESYNCCLTNPVY